MEETLISCACGAEYRRVVQLLPIRDIGLFECRECGVTLESWSGRSVPHFELVPAAKSKSAAA